MALQIDREGTCQQGAWRSQVLTAWIGSGSENDLKFRLRSILDEAMDAADGSRYIVHSELWSGHERATIRPAWRLGIEN